MNREQLLSYFEDAGRVDDQTLFARKVDDFILIVDCDDLGLQVATDIVIYDDGAFLVFAIDPDLNPLINVNNVEAEFTDFAVEVYVRKSVAYLKVVR